MASLAGFVEATSPAVPRDASGPCDPGARSRPASSRSPSSMAFRASPFDSNFRTSAATFGQDGPYRDRAALDLILQAESGMISTTGEPGSHGGYTDRLPLEPGGAP